MDGGDGTVREVVTALVELDWRPRLLVLPSGKINLIARDVGFARPRPDHFARLAGGAVQVRRRRLLRLDHAGGTSFGMLLGAAGFRLAWEMANRHLHRHGLASRMAVAAVLAVSLAQTAGGGLFAAGEPMRVRVDNGEVTGGSRFLLLATTLNRLMMGLWPFWGEGASELRVLDMAAPPQRLLAALPRLARGRPAPWMERAGYRSARAQRVEIELPGPVILDGEPFFPGMDGRLVLSLGPEMEFIRP
ncbi:MAG: hypothetical protein NVV74_23790 [Magnetospirillum sp.]|nr:hypothetical protein [Magnetospirillum sp.]